MSQKIEPINVDDAIRLAIAPFQSLQYMLDNIPAERSDPGLGQHVAILLGVCAERAERLLVEHVVPHAEG